MSIRNLKIALLIPSNLDGGMKTLEEGLEYGLSKFSKLSIIKDSEILTNHSNFNYIIRFGWTQNEVCKGFDGANFLHNISNDKTKNILFLCLNTSHLYPDKLEIIKKNFSNIFFDSSYSKEKGKTKINLPSFIINPPFINYKNSSSVLSKNHNNNFTFFNICSRAYKVKGLDILIYSFLNAFTPNDKVKLKILLKNKDNKKNEIENTFKQNNKLHQLEIIDKQVEHNKIHNLYTSSNCYVLSSREETFAIPPLEAAYYGIPVIMHTQGGMKDYADIINYDPVKGKHILMPKGIWKNNNEALWYEVSKESLSKAMVKTYKEKKLFPNQKEIILKNFSLESTAKNIYQIFQKIIKKRKLNEKLNHINKYA